MLEFLKKKFQWNITFSTMILLKKIKIIFWGRYYKLWIAIQDSDNNAHSLNMVTPVGITYFVKLDPNVNVRIWN